MKKTGFNGYVYDFSIPYDVTNVDDTLDIQKYLMKKKKSINKDVWICQKSAFYRIKNFIKFHKYKFVELYFNE